MNCNELINNEIIFRYVLTIISFTYLGILIYFDLSNNFIKKFIFLILPILLLLLDISDNFFRHTYTIILQSFGYNNNYNKCDYTFYYVYLDKICDSFSYVLTFLFLSICFKTDIILLLFIIYRIIGVVLFYTTKESIW